MNVNANFAPNIVGKMFLREHGTDAKMTALNCGTNNHFEYNPVESTQKLACHGEDLELNTSKTTIRSNLVMTKNVDLFAFLYGLDVVNTTNGTQTFTDTDFIFGDDECIELPYISNDSNGVTGIEVKSEDGDITYVLDTDYEVTVIGDRTFIKRLIAGAIVVNEKVLVTGSYNVEETKATSWNGNQYVGKLFDVNILGNSSDITGVKKYTAFKGRKFKLINAYKMEMKDSSQSGDVEEVVLEFESTTGYTSEFSDQNF